MHPYLFHLLSDITAAHRPEQTLPQIPRTFEEEMEAIERWVGGEDEPHTFGYWCGLIIEDFPPAELFTAEELLLVCEDLQKMMYSWNINTELPSQLPLPFKYEFMVKTLNEKTAIPEVGTMNFDFCSGYAPDCVFKEYCPCLKIWNETEEDEPTGFKDDGSECPF